MDEATHESGMQRKLVDALYVEAMLLADEARAYFDEAGRPDREALDPLQRVTFSCESLKVTTRLMHIIAWLLTQRAVEAGELQPRDALDPSRRLGIAAPTDAAIIDQMPPRAQALLLASGDLHRRIARLEEAQERGLPLASPARSIQQRLAAAF